MALYDAESISFYFFISILADYIIAPSQQTAPTDRRHQNWGKLTDSCRFAVSLWWLVVVFLQTLFFK